MFKTEHSIILVGANSPELDVIASELGDAGYNLSKATTVDDALASVADGHVALVLADQRLSEVDLSQAVEKLLGNNSIPVVFLVEQHDIDTCGRACNPVNGMCQFKGHACLSKPVDMITLRSLIKSMLLQAATLIALENKVHHLSRALDADRKTSMTVGVLMERLKISSEDAFETLRSHARSNRSKISSIAAEIIESLDSINKLNVEGRPSEKSSSSDNGKDSTKN